MFARSRSRWTRLFASGMTVLAILLTHAHLAHAQLNAPAFSKNYFLTGDYAVAGVPLKGTGANGFAAGDIVISGVPAGAQPVAAFLYWATIVPHTDLASAIAGAQFDGQNIASVSKILNPLGTSPCWS